MGIKGFCKRQARFGNIFDRHACYSVTFASTYNNISCPYIKVVLCVMAYLLYPRKAVPTGMIAGAGGQFLASPMDRVKIILQIEGASSSTSSLPRLVKGATLPPVAPSDVLRQDQRNMENSERYS